MKQFNYIQFLFDYGTLFVLALLCAWFSYVTIEEQSPTSPAAAERLPSAWGMNCPTEPAFSFWCAKAAKANHLRTH